MRDPNTDDGLAGTPQNRSHRTSESRDPLVEPNTTVLPRLRATDHSLSEEDAHKSDDPHRDVMALGTLVIQAQELNAESRKVMEELLDHKTQLEAAENEYNVSEVAKREYEVRMVRMDVEVQRLRRQAAETEERAVDLEQQHKRAQEKAERTEEGSTACRQAVARDEELLSTIAKKLQEKVSALGL